MANKEIDFEEVLITPLGKMISTIGRDIADSQLSMNEASLEAQSKLAERCPELHGLGYMVPWYNLSEVELEMKIAVHVEDERTQRGPGRTKGGAGGRMFFSPFNAKYQNNYRFGSNGSSSLKMKVMPVPPPQPLEPGADED